MGITGQDLLDRLKKKRSEEGDGEVKTGADERKTVTAEDLLYKNEMNKRYPTQDTSLVDQSYIDSFVTDVGKYGTSSWGDATSKYGDLYSRSRTIREWLKKNKANYSEKDYNAFTSMLDEADTGTRSVYEYFSQWDTEDAYKAYTAEEEANRKRLEELTGGYDTVKNRGEGMQGYRNYLDSKNKEAAERRQAENDKTLGEQLMGFFKDNPVRDVHASVLFARQNEYERHLPKDDWTGDQKATYGYLWSRDPDKATEYAYALNNEINATKERERLKKISEWSTQNFGTGLASTAGALLSAPLGLLDYYKDFTDWAALGYVPEADGDVSPFEYSQAVTGAISGKLNDKFGTIDEDAPVVGGKGFGDAYGLGVSTAQSLLAGLTVGKVGTLIQFFGSAGAAGITEAKQRGATDLQAILYGTFMGLAEGIAESIGIDNLIDNIGKSAARGVAKTILTQAASEGVEEGVTTLMNEFSDRIIMGDKSNFNVAVEKYISQGLSEKEAQKKAWHDFAGDVAFDMLGGAVSGAAHTGIMMPFQTHQQNKAYTQEGVRVMLFDGGYDALKNLAGEVSAEGLTSREAEIKKLLESTQRGHKAIEDGTSSKRRTNRTVRDIGKLSAAVETARGEQNLADIRASLESKGLSKSKAEKTAKLLAEAIEADGDYSDDLAERLDKALKDDAVYDAYLELVPSKSSVNSRNTKHALGRQGYKLNEDGDVVSAVGLDGFEDDAATENIPTAESGSQNEFEASAEGDEAVIEDMIARMSVSEETANALRNAYDPTSGVKAQTYAIDIPLAYEYGKINYEKGLSRLNLTELQAYKAYALGQADAAAKAKADAAKVQKTNAKGKVFYEFSEKRLSSVQKTSLKGLEALASALGKNIHIYESKVDAKGKRIGANGYYDPVSGDIYIDLFAGQDGKGAMLFTLAHELTHDIKAKNPEGFKKLADFLVEQYGEKGVDVEVLINNQIAKAKRNGRKISRDVAFEEFVADSMESMLADGEVLAKLKAKDQTLWETIKNYITTLIAKIKKVYEGLSPDSAEGRYVAEWLDSAQELRDMWVEALEGTRGVELTPDAEGTVVNDSGDSVAHSTGDGTIMLSMRTYEENGRDTLRAYLEKCVSSKRLTKAEMSEMLDGIEEIYDVCKTFKDKYAPFGSWSDAEVVRDTYGKPVFSVVTPNGEYRMNLDFSLVCKKRRTLDAVFNEMAKRGTIDNFELGQKSVVKINEIIRKYGLETACALCFVDAKRFRQASMADSFVNLYNELVRSMAPEGQAIDYFNFAGDKTLTAVGDGIHTWENAQLDFSHLDEVMKNYESKTVEHKTAKYLKTHAEGRKLLKRGDFMSSQGFDAVKTQNKTVLSLYNSKKGTGGPKAAFGDVQYMNEIIRRAGSWTPQKAYSVGGIRIQSFSDYVPRMVFDYVQMVYDLAARKLPAHAYTKEAIFVKQFGLTGVKINMSLIPAIADDGIAPGLDKNGNYVWAGESFNYDTAVEIQNAEGYTENCGTICVGVSKAHIEKLLADPNIRMVIPYHKSGLNPIVAHMNRVAAFTDYTDSQNTKDKNGKKVEKDFDFNKALHDMGRDGDPKAVADQYLKWCIAHEYTPKFAEFAESANYYKLLEDFALYDKDGNYVPQRGVKAVFPKEGDAFGSMKELIKSGLEEDAVVEGKRDKNLSSIVDEIEKSLPKTEAEIEETEVKQADRDLEEVKHSEREEYLHSDRDPEAVSNREILAGALESVAANDIEKNKLAQYKAKIEAMDAEQKKLKALRAEIKEISFSKGKRDTARLAELREEAAKTANRINTYDRQLLNLEATAALKGVLERERKASYKKAQQQGREALAEYRRKAAAKLDATKTAYREARQRGIESRRATEIRGQIRRFRDRMQHMIEHPNEKTSYIPASLMRAMVDVCDILSTDTELYHADGTPNKAQERRNLTKERLNDLKNEYEKLKHEQNFEFSDEYNEYIEADLKRLVDEFAGRKLKELSLDEVREVYEILKNIESVLTDARKLLGYQEALDVYEAADDTSERLGKIVRSRKSGERSKTQKANDALLYQSMSPMRNIERMMQYSADAHLFELFRHVELGVRKKNKFIMESYKMFEHLSTGKNKQAYEDALYKEYGAKHTDTLGRQFGVSKMQMMQCILSYERETANNMIHIENGGFSFADLKRLEKGDIKGATSPENIHTIPKANLLAQEFAKQLAGDEWAQKYMEAAREFFDHKAKDAINKTTLVTKKRLVATGKKYIPFETERSFVAMDISAENVVAETINTYGMLKETKDGASSAILITGLNNIISRHIDQVGSVYGLAIPIRDINKVWNCRTDRVTGNPSTVKRMMAIAWGDDGAAMLEQAIKDVQGSRASKNDALYRKIRSNYIGATFLINLSVVTKQIGSLYAAQSMIGYHSPISMFGNLVYTMANYKKIAAEVDEYTATAWMRRRGMSDGELSTLATEGKKTIMGRFTAKLPTALNPSKWIEGMDSAVALSLWKYCKQITAERTGLQGEELMRATASFFDDVVESTQSMADALHRPEIQKRGGIVSDALGLFKTDLYQMAGQLQVTAGRYQANKTIENRKALGRTVGAIAMSALWGQLMTTLFALLRYKVNHYRDDDDELTFESWLARQGFGLGADLIGYVFPLLGSEAVGMIESIMYGEPEDIVDNIVISTVNDVYQGIIEAGSSIKEGEMPSYAQMEKLTGTVLQLLGVPANNIIRTVNAIRLHAKDIANGEFFSFEAGLDHSAKNYIAKIAKSVESGDMTIAKGKYEEALEEMAMNESGEATDDDIAEAKSKLKTALGKKFKDGELSRATVEKILDKIFGLSDDDIYWQFDRWDYAAENGTSEGYAKYDDFYVAVETGKGIKSVIKTYTDNGVDKKALASQITSHFKPLYKEMTRSERARIKGYLLNAYVLLGYDRSKKSKDIDNWLKD